MKATERTIIKRELGVKSKISDDLLIQMLLKAIREEDVYLIANIHQQYIKTLKNEVR